MSEKPAPRRAAVASPRTDVTPVRLTRKLAEIIDGVDLSAADVGDHLELPRREADVLIAEGWAEPTGPRRRSTDVRSVADHESEPRNQGEDR